MQINLINYGPLSVDKEVSVANICDNKQIKHAMMAIVNNEAQDLNYLVKNGDNVNIVTLSETLGQKVFKRSITFLFFKVLNDLFPNVDAEVCHTINKGEFCRIFNLNIDSSVIEQIKNKMKEETMKNIKFVKTNINVNQMPQLIERQRLELYKTIGKNNCTIYSLDGYLDYSGGILVPDTSYLRNFDIIQLNKNGVLILCPKKNNPDELENYYYQPNLMKTFDQIETWSKINNIHYLSDMNKKVKDNEYSEMIQLCEALQESLFVDISKKIKEKAARVIFLTGPSSSGKTTSANRIKIQLMVQGSHPLVISMDDYFVNRENMVPDKDGKIDLEKIEVVDLQLFKEQIDELLSGKTIYLRKFDFKKGIGYYDDKETKIEKDSEIIIEGIHAFNPIVQNLFSKYSIYKVCVNPITYINIDNHNRISATDCRKIRRIVRDSNYRNISAEKTLDMWPSIRRGEESNIFPYLETADAIVNSSLAYELCVLKKYAEQSLKEIKKDNNNYAEAQRLLNLLSLVSSLNDESDIPKTSILKEFLS